MPTCPSCGQFVSYASAHTCPYPFGTPDLFTGLLRQATTNPNNAPDTLEQRIANLERRVAELERMARQAGFYD